MASRRPEYHSHCCFPKFPRVNNECSQSHVCRLGSEQQAQCLILPGRAAGISGPLLHRMTALTATAVAQPIIKSWNQLAG